MANWQDDFPMIDSYPAANGRKIEFSITAEELAMGYVVTAEETSKSRGKRCGYNFRMFSNDNPYTALGMIRQKIRKNLAVKYIDDSQGTIGLTHDKLVGRIKYSSEGEETCIEVDGREISIEQLKDILSTYEGFELFLKIKEQSET
jgi:hypothetical protein